MEHEPINVVLSPHGAELLRAAHNRHPEMSTTEILEQALSARFGREMESAAPRIRTGEEIRAWLEGSALSIRAKLGLLSSAFSASSACQPCNA
jgi:hypothetical protein